MQKVIRSITPMKKHRSKIRQFLKTIAPDFMWCTARDLFLMMEQIDEDVDENSFMVVLSLLNRDGHFHTKPTAGLVDGAKHPKALMYKRVA
jgi:hypothetical protein